jgi:hypothetical protein
MSATVGIATTGERPQALCGTVRTVIRGAARLSGDAEVLVVVNGRSRVPELERIESPLLRVVHLERRGVAGARNEVLARARHDTILFTDDDCEPPVDWCAVLAGALGSSAHVAVGAPVRTRIHGPVSAYLDHQRTMDAAAAGPGQAQTLVTANCGLRRDRLPAGLRFDPRLTSSGEDTALSLRIRAAGGTIGWLDGARPMLHPVAEDIGEIAARFTRYGQMGAVAHLNGGPPDMSIPGALDLYRLLTLDSHHANRRFTEVVAPQARHAFAAYDHLRHSCMLLGYLDRLGTDLGDPLVEVDHPALRDAWGKIDAEVRDRSAGLSTGDWAALEVDYARLGALPDEPQPLVDRVRAALRRHARAVKGRPGDRAAALLADGLDEAADRYLADVKRAMRLWSTLTAGSAPLTLARVESALRAAGLRFPEGSHLIEYRLRLARRAPL